VRLLGTRTLAPGDEGWVQIRLAQPVTLVKGDRYIIRQPSPSVTIGGGIVINPFPGRRHRRFRPEVIEQLETLAHGTPEEILLQNLERQQPAETRELLSRGSLSRPQAEAALATLVAEGQVLVLDSERLTGETRPAIPDSAFLISRSGWGALRERLEALLGEYHRQYALRAGMPREEVKSRLGQHLPALTPRLFNEIVARATAAGWLVEEGATIRLETHQATFTTKQQQAVDYLLYTFRQARYTTPSVSQCEEQVGGEVLAALIERGQLVKLNEDVILLAETYEEMRDRVVATIREQGSVTVAQVRDLFDTSRKYALGLLGYLDEQRITRRVGDERVLRGAS
jgi:selenocysteine-specific elongation factor